MTMNRRIHLAEKGSESHGGRDNDRRLAVVRTSYVKEQLRYMIGSNGARETWFFSEALYEICRDVSSRVCVATSEEV